MTTPGEIAVRLAAALLPQTSRERYREQWLGELRDAPEAGIRAFDIAVGSLVFAATLNRPLPSRSRLTPDKVLGRSRLAAGVALGAALVALTKYADILSSPSLTGMFVYDYLLFVGSTLLMIYVVLAPVFGVLLVTLTRGTSTRIRTAVWLFAAASLAPVAQELIDSPAASTDNIFLSPGAAAYLVAMAAVIAAGVLLRKGFRTAMPPVPMDSNARILIMSVLGGVIVLVIAAACLNDAVALWSARTPLVFGGEIDGALYREWIALKAQGESLVSSVFFAWGAVCVVVGCVVAIGGLRRRSTVRGLVVRLVVALILVTITYAAVVNFLYLMTPSAEPAVPTESLTLLSRWLIIAVALVTVGRVRFTRHADPGRGHAKSPFTILRATSVNSSRPATQSSSEVNSRSLCEIPSALGTNSMIEGTTSFMLVES